MLSEVEQFPDWVRDAVFYQVFPDRFARSTRLRKPGNLETWDSPPTIYGYKGGDLLGVAERLDHVESLGANALYLTPIFSSGSNHRYHTHDYFRVDPLLGGDSGLGDLLTEAHARGLKVILDGVFNHSGRGLLQFNDVLENGPASPYVDWFHINSFPLNAYGGGQLGYDAWWGLPALPKFNTKNPEVREFLMSVGEYWLKRGIDGWRLDVPSEINDDAFWQEFRHRCRAINPDAYLVGEIWEDASRWLKGDIFDGVMNYPLTRAIFGLVGRSLNTDELMKSGLNGVEELDATGFAEVVSHLLTTYPQGAVYSQLNLLGSHDTPRLKTSLGGDMNAVRQAYLLLFALPGAPTIYYGDELGLEGGHDPYCRGTMPWDAQEAWDHDLLNYLRSLGHIRAQEAALRRGSTRLRALRSDLLLIERHLDSEREGKDSVFALVNSSGAAASVPAGALPPGDYRDLLNGGLLTIKNGAAIVPARGGSLLKAAS